MIAWGQITGAAASIDALADLLSEQAELRGREVLNQTGLKGKYDFTLQWTPGQSAAAMPGPDGARTGIDNPPPPDSSGPSLFTALQEQLGLKLEATKGPVEVLVIDHIEKPSEN
jgi:uncharacterized protein (TIGR03435 family)